MRRRLGLDHRLPRRPAARDRRADRRQRHRPASRARYRLGALSAQPHRPRPEGALRHAGRRAQSRARQAARPAAPESRPAHRIQPIRRRHSVRRCGAARRQQFRRRPAGLDPEVQGLGERSQRLHLLHHSGAGLGRDLRSDRRADLEDRSGRYATPKRAAAEAEGDLRAHRRLDHDHDQVRGHGNVQRGRYSGRADPVDEGNRRGASRCARPAPWSRSIIRCAASI